MSTYNQPRIPALSGPCETNCKARGIRQDRSLQPVESCRGFDNAVVPMSDDLIDCAINTQSLSLLFQMLVDRAGTLGFDSVACAAVTYLAPRRLPNSPAPMIASNFAFHGSQQYTKREYGNIDPAIHRLPRFASPVRWDQLSEECQLLPHEQRVLEFYALAGLKHGVSVPYFAAYGRISVALFASETAEPDPQGSLPHLSALASQFFIAYSLLAPLADEKRYLAVTFTPREREIMFLMADGKSSSIISTLLNISDNTVNFHIKNILNKVGAGSRIVALRDAYRAGLIPYRPPRNE
ncbi:helix-turn-helix transcriptional regulator [Bradyrhizobium sp. DOA9]|uniref:helix-turn-helix transcriptional regulator n=1 Tax=Bradyrhizobium sp. DOA9 TaxID=1126627 RepID=UPI0012603D19|nr:LuxR family transcriptional regulator [Bradyrhizobium sp. DOA9]